MCCIIAHLAHWYPAYHTLCTLVSCIITHLAHCYLVLLHTLHTDFLWHHTSPIISCIIIRHHSHILYVLWHNQKQISCIHHHTPCTPIFFVIKHLASLYPVLYVVSLDADILYYHTPYTELLLFTLHTDILCYHTSLIFCMITYPSFYYPELSRTLHTVYTDTHWYSIISNTLQTYILNCCISASWYPVHISTHLVHCYPVLLDTLHTDILCYQTSLISIDIAIVLLSCIITHPTYTLISCVITHPCTLISCVITLCKLISYIIIYPSHRYPPYSYASCTIISRAITHSTQGYSLSSYTLRIDIFF